MRGTPVHRATLKLSHLDASVEGGLGPWLDWRALLKLTIMLKLSVWRATLQSTHLDASVEGGLAPWRPLSSLGTRLKPPLRTGERLD